MPWIHSLVGVKTFYRVLWKVAGNCMKNGNKSPNMTYSAMVWRVEKWSGTHIDDRITTKRLFIVPTGSPIRTSSFNEIMCISFALTCRQTHRQTHKQDWIHNLLQPSLAEITQHNTTQHNTTNSETISIIPWPIRGRLTNIWLDTRQCWYCPFVVDRVRRSVERWSTVVRPRSSRTQDCNDK